MAPSSKRASAQRASTHDSGINAGTGTDAGTAASTTLSSAATSASTSPTTSSRTTPSASTVKISSPTAGNGAVPSNSSTLSTTSAATTSAPSTSSSRPTIFTSTPARANPNQPPPTSPQTGTASKLPRFLQSPLQRDRSKSLSVDRPPSAASSSSHSHTSASTSTSTSSGGGRKSGRFLGLGSKDAKERERERQRIREVERAAPSAAELLTLHEGTASPTSYDFDEPSSPPSAYGGGTARPHMRSERRFSFSQSTPPSSLGHGADYPNGQTLQLQRSPSRLGADGALASRLSGWFAHLAGSTSDLSLTSTVGGALSHSVSTASALASSASKKHSGEGGSKTGLLDKAVRYLLDGDAAPDRSQAEIWLMGVKLPGWGRADEERVAAALNSSSHSHSHHSSHSHSSPSSSRRSSSSADDAPDPGPWPAAFHAAFYAQVWCTYRAGFEPIRDLPSLASLPPPLTFSGPPGAKKRWWALGGGGQKGWTSDAGWGCMLRTAQSLLATALARVGDPSPPLSFAAHTTSPTAFAAHARLLSWFLDAPAAPFGVHRMALAGKAAGKDVGMWFGPSAAAGAVRMLVDGFPACGLGVSVATDGTLYQTEVYAASHSPAALAALQASARSPPETRAWGDRPVLLLLGIRLGLDGVNPVYYETIKMLYTFPQSVGIAGGRPSSSYYFVGVQGDGLFYLDPHHSRPAVPLRPFVPSSTHPTSTHEDARHATNGAAHDTRRSLSPEAYARGGSLSPDYGYARAGSMSPDSHARAGSMSPDFAHAHAHAHAQEPMTEDELYGSPRALLAVNDHAHTHDPDDAGTTPAGGPLSPAEAAHFARAYSVAELRTFHCERVRKMPLSGLDPSMLLGFVCRDEAEWVDLRRRIAELPRTIFAIQDEPPTWPGADDDDDMGLESISDPEEAEEEAEDAGDDDGDVSSASHAVSTSSHGVSNSSHIAAARSEEVDTEDDPVAPVTPLPGSRFDIPPPPTAGKGAAEGPAYPELEDEGDDGFVDAGDVGIEDDWVDPVAAPPPPAPAAIKKSSSSKGKGKSRGKKAVPVPSVHYPFPVSVEDSAPVTPAPQVRERDRNVTVSPRAGGGGGAVGQRMHTARARDGGRTQSGGVRGVLTEDS
ncbi:peptidase family C54-domain-containing protein [Mycena maculata]|uniref:Autophagy-related protein 4 n=1 Tax=Mycena maculata TaxID=230809 RepID=A0AAD7H8R4_9AGAR|nr:peptidase family C54-domain-containing protein [Mycena maculata]